jgi:hypothetical protein
MQQVNPKLKALLICAVKLKAQIDQKLCDKKFEKQHQAAKT